MRVPPSIKNYEVKIAKKFKGDLPERYAFIFEDNYPEGFFYNFMDRRFERNGVNVNRFVPIEVDSSTYYMSFYEVKRIDKSVSLLNLFINGEMETDVDAEDSDVSKEDYWYIAITVSDQMDQDVLNKSYKTQAKVVDYLRALQLSYQNSSNRQ
ncbi:hypothetical protein GCM10022260_05030 [Gaetbulibacter aestuarii]